VYDRELLYYFLTNFSWEIWTKVGCKNQKFSRCGHGKNEISLDIDFLNQRRLGFTSLKKFLRAKGNCSKFSPKEIPEKQLENKHLLIYQQKHTYLQQQKTSMIKYTYNYEIQNILKYRLLLLFIASRIAGLALLMSVTLLPLTCVITSP